MLVLSRHRDEGITIGDGIRVVVVDIRGDKVRLGIEAPKNVPVHRDEVLERIHAQQTPEQSAGEEIYDQHIADGNYDMEEGEAA